MTRLALSASLLAALFALAGCGADGAPEQPAPKPGIVLEGEAEVGVVFR